MTPDELLSTTRSVRRRLDLSRPVDLAVVTRCVEIALQAPNGGNSQRWHWVIVTDPELRARIGAVYRRAFEGRYPPPQDPPPQDPPPQDVPPSAADREPPSAHERMMRSSRHLAAHLHEVPVLVIPCLRVPGGRLPEGSQAGTWGSLLPAVWSYMLAARARGLGAAWTSVHLDFEQEVAELLGLPDDVRQGALIPTAHLLGSRLRPAPRGSVEEVLHFDGWTTPPAGTGGGAPDA
ncbi:nitroreductase family protein [Streptomyces sp. NPDC006733]|uniref:nitroreductase family protein n=1 Tax=Streptomyces sp. NPDC006733 TaxID=3155460 RepID=UPI0033DFA46C